MPIRCPFHWVQWQDGQGFLFVGCLRRVRDSVPPKRDSFPLLLYHLWHEFTNRIEIFPPDADAMSCFVKIVPCIRLILFTTMVMVVVILNCFIFVPTRYNTKIYLAPGHSAVYIKQHEVTYVCLWNSQFIFSINPKNPSATIWSIDS